MTIKPPPLYEKMTEGNGKPTVPWALFFNELFIGDQGKAWTPEFTNLTEVGGDATITGRIYRLSSALVFFRIDVDPETNTSAVAGSTYVEGLPVAATANGVCLSVSGNSGGALGIVRESDSRIYVPDWTTVTDKVTVLGIVEAR